MDRIESISGFFSKIVASLAVLLVVVAALLSWPGSDAARRAPVVLGGACVALIAVVGVAVVRLRGHERELRSAVNGLENQTIVLEQQAARLRHKEREVRALNEQLEARVEQRTRELALANQALEAANKSKSQFLANMSHELRTPMTAVLGYADLLLDQDLSAEERLDHVLTIKKNGEHLLSVVNDILDLSKIEAGRMTVERIPCSPPQIVAEVASLMQVRALGKRLSIHVLYETPIPEIIHSDPTRLRQILLNLVGNAIKFTESGSVKLLVRCDPERHTISFEIADTGIGMSKEAIERLFQPFMQADSSTTRVFGGTGMGLAICRRLSGMLGGDIQVTSLVGRGSSFVLTLDAGALDGVRMVEAPPPPPPAPPTAPPSLVRVDGRILLAEDNRANQTLIASFLRKAGMEVHIAENGRIALDRALAELTAGRGFDVILMDMQMPELDGYGATRALRERGCSTPIIALTAHAMDGDRENCLAAGCDDHLTKPVDRPSLIVKVADWIQRARSRPATPTPAFEAPAATRTARTLGDSAEGPLVSELTEDPDMVDLIPEFVQYLPGCIAELGDAMASSAVEHALSIAHQLKGSAGGYGFPSITEAASRLEHALQEGADARAVAEALEHLRALCARTHVCGVAA